MMKNNKKNLTSHKPWWAFELFTDDIGIQRFHSLQRLLSLYHFFSITENTLLGMICCPKECNSFQVLLPVMYVQSF